MYENPWLFNGEPFTSDMIGKFVGFVYCIENKLNGKKYIGKKNFYFIRKLKGNKRRTKFESDWMEYYGSSIKLKEEVEKLGHSNFQRTILFLCLTKGAMNYGEVREQILRNVIEDEGYYNDSIHNWRNVQYTKNVVRENVSEIYPTKPK